MAHIAHMTTQAPARTLGAMTLGALAPHGGADRARTGHAVGVRGYGIDPTDIPPPPPQR